jgi:hypothetical protein
MVDSKDTPEKTSLHQSDDTPVQNSPYIADLKQDGLVADAEASSLGSPAFQGVDEKAVLRKMDIRLIPMLSLLYLLAFLDRGNIGNAKIEGLVDDLHMTGPQYNWTCMIYPFPSVACFHGRMTN